MALKRLTTVALTLATLSLAACQPVEMIRGGGTAKKVAAENENMVQEILSEGDYFDTIDTDTYVLYREFEELFLLIPEDEDIDQEETEVVIAQAKKITPLLDKIMALQAPDKYKDTQEKFQAGAKELEIYIKKFIDEMNSFIYVNLEDIEHHFDDGYDLIVEADDELQKLYYGEDYDKSAFDFNNINSF